MLIPGSQVVESPKEYTNVKKVNKWNIPKEQQGRKGQVQLNEGQGVAGIVRRKLLVTK
jgi:hypothetical protein